MESRFTTAAQDCHAGLLPTLQAPSEATIQRTWPSFHSRAQHWESIDLRQPGPGWKCTPELLGQTWGPDNLEPKVQNGW